MSKLKSVFGKRRKKIGENVPQKYNGLYQFNHGNIINDSLQTNTILNGCTKSNTLYLEGEVKTKSFGFIFTGKRGCKVLSVMKERLTGNFPDSLLLAEKGDCELIDKKISFIEIPENQVTKQTFSKGIEWFEINQVSINGYIERSFRDVSFIFLVLDNNAFSMGVISKIIEILKEKEIQAVLLLNFPADPPDSIDREEINQITRNSVSVLSFIHYLMNKDSSESLPFIIFNESTLIKQNSMNEEIDILREKMIHREANLLIDFMIGSQISSEFYRTDFGNFIKTFENTKGLCNLLSLDIYDNKPNLSELLKQKKILETFESKDKSTRGYLIIQPGSEGLPTSVYHEIRKQYSNLDIVLSVQKRRENGAVVRGIFSYLDIPKQILNKFGILSEVIIELLDEEDSVTGYLDTSKLEDLWIHDIYRIQRITKEEKNE